MSTQWVNTVPDAGALHALLLSLTPRVTVADIDQLWIFPTRKIAIGESTVVVLSLFDEEPDRRRVMTARFTVTRDKKGIAKVQDKLDEYGSAPLEAVSRVVDGVVRRLGEDVEQPPRQENIDRSSARWQELLIELGAPASTFDDPARENADALAAVEDAAGSEASTGTEAPTGTEASVGGETAAGSEAAAEGRTP
jgi:hypothetical protein